MSQLVMLDLDAGPRFVDALRAVWDAGDAAFPLDRRLPPSEAERIVEISRPTAVIDHHLERRSLDGGRPLEDGDALLVATSGTSGEPKAVIHTHASMAASAMATSQALQVDPTADRWLACLPPAHIGGLSVIVRALLTDTALVVHPGFDADAVDQAARDGATLVSLVTRALNQIDVSGFRRILIGGAAPPVERAQNVIATYGMTETGSGCVYDGYPLDEVELRQAGNGEIEVRGPMMLRAYRTRDADFSPLDDDGWFRTGDLGHIEADGRLWIDGRAGDMIISGGQNVWPNRAERRLEAHEAVAEAAVIGRPDPEWGQVVVAVITVAPGHEPPTLDELRDFVRVDLPRWYAPRELRVVEALPKTALGKVRRADL